MVIISAKGVIGVRKRVESFLVNRAHFVGKAAIGEGSGGVEAEIVVFDKVTIPDICNEGELVSGRRIPFQRS